MEILEKTDRNYPLAIEATKQICELQQKRQDEEFHIDSGTAICMIYDIVKEYLDKEHELTKKAINW